MPAGNNMVDCTLPDWFEDRTEEEEDFEQEYEPEERYYNENE